MIVLIPAFEPDRRLAELVLGLHRSVADPVVVVVDDGSSPSCRDVFDAARAAGAEVIGYPVNHGKGYALRAGLTHILAAHPGQAVVTADADGQHTVDDILCVGAVLERTGRMVLGVREFAGEVPLRSRLGNAATAVLFRASTGWKVEDTQTGLRGFPPDQLEWLTTIGGDRYEYELSVLLGAADRHLDVIQVPVRTLYEPGNASSHFRPIRDSARIYLPLLAFSASSLASFVVDYVGVLALHAVAGGLVVPVVGARILSGTVNYLLNRRVFRGRRSATHRSAVRYLALALLMLSASYLLLTGLTAVGMPLWLAKLIVDPTLFLVSYRVQRTVVFREREGAAQPIEPAEPKGPAAAAQAVRGARPVAPVVRASRLSPGSLVH